MKILVLPKPIEGVSREELLSHAAAEIQDESLQRQLWEESAKLVNLPARILAL